MKPGESWFEQPIIVEVTEIRIEESYRGIWREVRLETSPSALLATELRTRMVKDDADALHIGDRILLTVKRLPEAEHA